MSITNYKHLMLLALLAWSAVTSSALAQDVSKHEADYLSPQLKLNEIQVVGTHNSYALGLDPRVNELFTQAVAPMLKGYLAQLQGQAKIMFEDEHPNGMEASEMLNYAHLALDKQLSAGVRGLEIDIHPDPKGGAYLNPLSYKVLNDRGVKDLLPLDTTGMDQPGFKVFHIPDVDVRSSCPTLRSCLSVLKKWSESNPKHVPIYIMLEAKTPSFPLFPNGTVTLPFSEKLFDDLDQELIDGLGRDRIIAPDDVRGQFATLNAAVKAKNWPTLQEARGKFIFLMLAAPGANGIDAYLKGHESLKGRMAFLRSQPGSDYAAFLLLDNAISRFDEIQKYVKEGYMVRTRADIETYEAKVNDMTRAQKALASGAQVVSTDFVFPGNSYGTNYIVQLPGKRMARCNEVNVNCSR